MATLYLIPVTLGDTPLDNVLPSANHDVIVRIRHFIVEEIRSARRFLKQTDKSIDIDTLTFYPMGKHADKALFSKYLDPLRNGVDMGIISEAGCPAIADPGADVVAIAQSEGLKVVPLVGPSSILMSLMASGFNGQQFAFHGYLPVGSHERQTALRNLEATSHAHNQTQIFIETPYRNHQMIDNIISVCRPTTKLCIAAGITCGDNEFIQTKTIRQWRNEKSSVPDLRKTPAIFLIYAGQD
ncbi:MAG: SAM-dependent methyltransferase [Bacteroidaceae bacterium]|nr:SAM-dependent methyltransferase [Bacteroidaceae bacterium]